MVQLLLSRYSSLVVFLAALGLASGTKGAQGTQVEPLAGRAVLPVDHDYTRAHFYPRDYDFAERDGWMSASGIGAPGPERRALAERELLEARSLNVSSSTDSPQARHIPEMHRHNKAGGVARRSQSGKHSKFLGGVASNIFAGMKGTGSLLDVIITWYTGQDLLNPSCWSEGQWHPSDSSFACAVTADGWTDRPQCFSFLELCTTGESANRCVFVRVVDSCAGCKKGSKHVDLTKGAFGQLADLGVGKMNVKMRGASEPEKWNQNIWGPKA